MADNTEQKAAAATADAAKDSTNAAAPQSVSRNKTVAIGCDHGGYPLKVEILKYLFKHQFIVMDCGTDSASASVDYPEYGRKVAELVQSGEVEFGILMCSTGIGMSMAANKVSGVRCALVGDTFSAHRAREHNDANILALGASVTGSGLAVDIVDIFLNTAFSNEDRHRRRVGQIKAIEDTYISKQ